MQLLLISYGIQYNTTNEIDCNEYRKCFQSKHLIHYSFLTRCCITIRSESIFSAYYTYYRRATPALLLSVRTVLYFSSARRLLLKIRRKLRDKIK